MWSIGISKRGVISPLRRSIFLNKVSQNEQHAEYPPILDLNTEPSKLRSELEFHEKIRNLHTVEEKAIGINIPR